MTLTTKILEKTYTDGTRTSFPEEDGESQRYNPNIFAKVSNRVNEYVARVFLRANPEPRISISSSTDPLDKNKNLLEENSFDIFQNLKRSEEGLKGLILSYRDDGKEYQVAIENGATPKQTRTANKLVMTGVSTLLYLQLTVLGTRSVKQDLKEPLKDLEVAAKMLNNDDKQYHLDGREIIIHDEEIKKLVKQAEANKNKAMKAYGFNVPIGLKAGYVDGKRTMIEPSIDTTPLWNPINSIRAAYHKVSEMFNKK